MLVLPLLLLLLLLPCLCWVGLEVEKAVAWMNCCEGFLTSMSQTKLFLNEVSAQTIVV